MEDKKETSPDTESLHVRFHRGVAACQTRSYAKGKGSSVVEGGWGGRLGSKGEVMVAGVLKL